MFPLNLPPLQNHRIELRALVHSDVYELFEIYGDAQVMKFTDEKPFESLATVSIMLKSVSRLLAEGESLEWGVVIIETGTLVGTCGLHSFNKIRQAAEVGCILKSAAWGHGYMKEAVSILTLYAKDDLKLKELMADVHPENKRAQRMFHNLGFRRDSPGLWRLGLTL